MKLHKKIPIIIIFIILLLYITLFVLYSGSKNEEGEDVEVKNTLFNDYTEDNIKEIKTYVGGRFYTINASKDMKRFLEIVKSVTLTEYKEESIYIGGFIFEIYLHDGTNIPLGVFSDKINGGGDYNGYYKTDKNILDELMKLFSVWQ